MIGPRALGILTAVLVVAVPAAASASPRTGRWTGRGTNVHGKLTFKVASGGHRIKGLRFAGKYGSLHCGGGLGQQPTVGSTTVFLPKAKIHAGHISGTRKHTAAGVHEKDVVHGSIGRKSAHGTLRAKFTGAENCGTPTIHWKARFGRKAPSGGGSSGGKSIAGGRYKGKTAQGYGMSIAVSKSGRKLSDLTVNRIDLDCIDGSSEHYTGVGFSSTRVKSDGSFSDSGTLSDGSELNVTGKIGRKSAHGVVGMSDPNAACESGNVSFKLARR